MTLTLKKRETAVETTPSLIRPTKLEIRLAADRKDMNVE